MPGSFLTSLSSRHVGVAISILMLFDFFVTIPVARARINGDYGNVPLIFELNQGQSKPEVRFLSRGPGYTVLLTSTESIFVANGVRTKLVGGNPSPRVVGLEALPGKSNYFIGRNSAKWIRNVPQYSRVRYEEVYPGIDLDYYGNQQRLEYDFIVNPGADPKSIMLAFDGAQGLSLDNRGDLVLTTEAGPVRQSKPVIYQEIDGVRRDVAGAYLLQGKNRAGFQIGSYDPQLPLVIDPVLIFSTHLGGSDTNNAKGIAVDTAGNTYVIGETTSLDFPTVVPFSPGRARGDVFIAKLDATGSHLLYATYLGGFASDVAAGIAVDSKGQVYAAGSTNSQDFPTVNALQDHYGGGDSDAWIAKLDVDGSLVYSTYLGTSGGASSGVDTATGIAVDLAGSAYVIGTTGSTVFPTVNPAQPGCAGYIKPFVAKLNPEGTALVYSSCFRGGSAAGGIAVDSTGEAYLGGVSLGEYSDSIVTKLSADGATVVYSTNFAGTSRATASAVAVDSSGSAYVTGSTTATDFPTVNPLQPALAGATDAFIVKLNPAGTVAYASYLGGDGIDAGRAIAVDAAGNILVAGETYSTNFPVANALQPANGGGSCDGSPCYDGFFVKLSPPGDALLYSTYMGGSGNDYARGLAVDSNGNAYGVGVTFASDFPVAHALQGIRRGISDAFVVRIQDTAPAHGNNQTFSTPRIINVGRDSKPGAILLSSIFNSPASFDQRSVAFRLDGGTKHFAKCRTESENLFGHSLGSGVLIRGCSGSPHTTGFEAAGTEP